MNKLIKIIYFFLISSLLLSRGTGTIHAVEPFDFIPAPEDTQYQFILMQDGKKVSEDKFYLEEQKNGKIFVCYTELTTFCFRKVYESDKPLYLYKKQHEIFYETHRTGLSGNRTARVPVVEKEETDELVAILDLPYLGEAVYRYGIVELDKVGQNKVATFQRISKEEYQKAFYDPDYLPQVAFLYTAYARVLVYSGVLVIAFVVVWQVRRLKNKKRKKGKNA